MNTRDVTDKVQDWQQRATETAKNLGVKTDRYVHDNTWATIGIAVVVGCMFGYLLAGGRDSED